MHACDRPDCNTPDHRVTPPSRRQVLRGAAGALAAAALPLGATRAASAKAHRIDVHHHLAPPEWVHEWAPTGQIFPIIRDWTPEKSLEDMDRGGVSTAILSVTIPGVVLPDVAAGRKLTRACNDYAMRLVSDHQGRFGMFPALPLPDVDGSLKEIEYVLDVLKADGIGLFTSYGDKWLGDPAFDPVMAELNRRKAVVYTHPTVANCCRNLLPDVPPAVVEYGTDTSRAIARLLFSGAATRFPDIRWIFSHAGGTMPFLVERFLFQAKSPQGAKVLPNGVMPELRKFNYDIAQSFDAPPMLALKKLVPLSQILFGTDFPFRTTEEHVKGLRASGVFTARELQAIERDNALKLLPPRYRA
ncbi:MAG TPA: amidohydrolase family protein [Candidatus Sulfotelmatobacter sp.]|nr:amidohydrolase family protein [Candidatus Sulfotelmatobacter sp.]